MCDKIDEVNLTFNEQDFEKLKKYFKEIINSNRRFEQITTVKELVRVLENRDALTDDILLKCEPQFINFVKATRKNHSNFKRLILPQNVISCIAEDFLDNWELLGVHLKIREDQLKQCQDARDVLSYYAENCDGISHHEMIFRLNRAVEKCGKSGIKNKVIEVAKEY